MYDAYNKIGIYITPNTIGETLNDKQISNIHHLMRNKAPPSKIMFSIKHKINFLKFGSS